MRSVFVFPAGDRAATVALLDHRLPEQRQPWTLDGNLYINIDDEQDGALYADWEPDELAALEAALGHRPDWAVQIDVSGRINGTAEVKQVVAVLLAGGGVAYDDYTDHPWTLPEIESGETYDGLAFFDFQTHYDRTRSGRAQS